MQDKPRLLFVVMSAVVPGPVVEQLARSLAPHQVLIHHDFTQLRDFTVVAPNAQFVPDPKVMGWGVWGFSNGVFHALQHAVRKYEFDYLQLLSSSCLPIKSVRAFQDHVTGSPADAHVGCIPVKDDIDVLMSIGWRAFAPQGSLRQRALRWLTRAYFGDGTGRRDVAGIWLRSGPVTDARGNPKLIARVAKSVHELAANPVIGRHIFDDTLVPWYGSTWFGARRSTVEGMLALFEQPRIRRYFERVWIADELIIPTLIRNTTSSCGRSNFVIGRFDEARPRTFDESDVPMLRDVPEFFARKFPSDAQAPVRLRVLRELVGVDPRQECEACLA